VAVGAREVNSGGGRAGADRRAWGAAGVRQAGAGHAHQQLQRPQERDRWQGGEELGGQPVGGVGDVQGTLLSPSELAVGSHSVSYTEDGPLGHYEDGITIFIDPAGEDGCLNKRC
jgi:hypothetical protein